MLADVTSNSSVSIFLNVPTPTAGGLWLFGIYWYFAPLSPTSLIRNSKLPKIFSPKLTVNHLVRNLIML